MHVIHTSIQSLSKNEQVSNCNSQPHEHLTSPSCLSLSSTQKWQVTEFPTDETNASFVAGFPVFGAYILSWYGVYSTISVLKGARDKSANVTKYRFPRLRSQQFIRATAQEGVLTKVSFKCFYSTRWRESDSNRPKPQKKDPGFLGKDSSAIKWFVSPQQFTFIKIDNRRNHCQNRASNPVQCLNTVSKLLTNRHKAMADQTLSGGSL